MYFAPIELSKIRKLKRLKYHWIKPKNGNQIIFFLKFQ